MSQENVEIVRWAYEEFVARGTFVEEVVTSDFVWDMSNFSDWPEQQVYEGAAGASRFLEDWTAAWDDWEFVIDALYDAGDRVVAIAHQNGRSKLTGLSVEMSLAQIWTMRDGKQARMDMYSDPVAALHAVGLTE
jgi:ketosteroid isomerase-like protein